MTAEVENATKTLNGLMDQREQLVARSNKIISDRQAISYAAHAGNDKGAKERLRKLNDETLLHSAELESMDAAIAEANSRLAAAQQAETQAADRANAEALRIKLARFKELGFILDDCFADFASAASEMKDVLGQMHQLGAASPSQEQLRVLGALAVKTGLLSGPWSKEFDPIAPNQRKSFKALVAGWSAMIEQNNIAHRLDEQQQEKVA